MGSAVPRTHFSTTDLPADDGFDAWRDKMSVIFDVVRLGGSDAISFEARVDAYQIGNLVVTDSRQDEQAYSLTPKRIRTAGIDLIQVGLYRSGGYRGDANGNAIAGCCGDLQILDLARPMQSVEAASEMVCVFIPREILQDRIGDLDGLHGVELHARMGGLLADYLRLLAERLPRMPDRDGEAAANATIEIIAACLRPSATAIGRAQSPIEDVMLLRAKQVIECHLRSPQLTPDFLCRALGISRRSLYRVFEPLDGVHRYVLRRRLSRVMRILKDPQNRQRIADLAADYGFGCQETFWRAFKRQFGMTPGEVRSLSAPPPARVPQSTDAGFDVWLKRLHV